MSIVNVHSSHKSHKLSNFLQQCAKFA